MTESALPKEAVTPTDSELLWRFRARKEKAAFEVLLKRHERLVFGVCYSVLGNLQDAEDAFQATFLILAQRGRNVERHRSAAGWLYKVALRTAINARSKRREDVSLDTMPEPTTESDELSRIHDREVALALHEELAKLPEKYRGPLVLCYLEGRSREEAAAMLETTPNAIKGRLARGKSKLRIRLVRRGVALSLSIGAANTLTACESEYVSAAGSRAVDTCIPHFFGTGRDPLASKFVESLVIEGVRQMTIASARRAALISLVVISIAGGALVSLDSHVHLYAQGQNGGTVLTLAAQENTAPPVEGVTLTAQAQSAAAAESDVEAESSAVDDAVQALIAALSDPEAIVRHTAANALAEVGRGSQEASKALIDAAKQRDDRELATLALKSLSTVSDYDAIREEASRGLFQIFQSNNREPKFRRALIQTVGKIGGQAGIRAATVALSDSDKEVRVAGAEALATIMALERRRATAGWQVSGVPTRNR